MKVEIKREALHGAIKVARKFITGKSLLESANDVLIRATEGGITIEGNDGRVALVLPVEGEVAKEGVISAPIEKLHKLLSASSAETASIRMVKAKDKIPAGHIGEGEAVEVTRSEMKLGRGKYKLAGLAPEAWPVMPETDKPDHSLMVAGKALVEIGGATKRCINDKEERFAFDCCHLSVEGELIRGVATDSRRMASVERGCGDVEGGDFELIVPPKTLETFGKEVAFEDERIRFSVLERHLVFEGSGGTVIVGRRSGKFPPLAKVLGNKPAFVVRFNRVELLEAVQSAAAMAGDKVKVLDFDFSIPSGKTAAVSFEDVSGKADVTVEMQADPIDEEDRDHARRAQDEVMVDAAMLADILKGDDEEVAFGFVLKGKGPDLKMLRIETEAATWFVMPVVID